MCGRPGIHGDGLKPDPGLLGPELCKLGPRTAPDEADLCLVHGDLQDLHLVLRVLYPVHPPLISPYLVFTFEAVLHGSDHRSCSCCMACFTSTTTLSAYQSHQLLKLLLGNLHGHGELHVGLVLFVIANVKSHVSVYWSHCTYTGSARLSESKEYLSENIRLIPPANQDVQQA